MWLAWTNTKGGNVSYTIAGKKDFFFKLPALLFALPFKNFVSLNDIYAAKMKMDSVEKNKKE